MRQRVVCLLTFALIAGGAPGAGAGHVPLSPETQHAVTVALHGIVRAGLFDPLGDYYSYEAVTEVEGVWTVSFVANRCYRTTTVETCDPYQGRSEHVSPDAWIEVTEQDGAMRIVDARGRFTEEARDQMIGYGEPATPQPARLEFPTARLDPPLTERDQWSVRAAHLWAGVIPDGDRVWEVCLVELLDENGQVVRTRRQRIAMGTRGEDFRAGGMLGFTLRDPHGATDVAITCEPFAGETWEIVSEPDVTRWQGRVFVHADVEWAPGFLAWGLDTRCDITLRDRRGRALKTVDRRGPPSPWERGRHHATFYGGIRVPRPQAVESADVYCHEA